MKEHPIIFSTEMVKAILEGRKTQTRRVIKPQPYIIEGAEGKMLNGSSKSKECFLFIRMRDNFPVIMECPYGQVGSKLWVRETWGWSGLNRVEYKAFPADGKDFRAVDRWRPSIHMFHAVSRITLEITDVRVEKLQEITDEDAKAEGVDVDKVFSPDSGHIGKCYWTKFRELWNSIHKKEHRWEDNPWVWVISFKRLNRS